MTQKDDMDVKKGMNPRVAIVIRGKEFGLLPQDLIRKRNICSHPYGRKAKCY